MNDFLLHIGWLTLSMSAVILLALLFYRLVGARFSAKSRYAVWTVIVLSLCVGVGLYKLPTVFTFEIDMHVFAEETHEITPADTIVRSPITPTEPITVPDSGTEVTVPPTPMPPQNENVHIDPTAVIFAIWALGAVTFFAAGIAVYIRTTYKYARSKTLCDPETERLFAELGRKFALRRLPSIYVCAKVDSPILYGYTKPTILLPDIKLTQNSLVGVLAHELTHYRRGDIWVKLVCLLAESLYWFNPLVHLAAARCNSEMELSCDETVLAGMDEDARRSYGSVMLDIVEHCSHRRSLLTTQFNPHKNAVKERIMNILDTTKKKRGRFIVGAALILCLAASAFIGCGVTNNGKQAENSGITAYDKLSDFLSDEQIAVYETAHNVYGLLIADPAGIETLHFDGSFSKSEGRYFIGEFYYEAARGKYRSYPEFRALCLTAFTDAYYDELNRTGTDSAAFIEKDGRLYYRDTILVGESGRDLDEHPDTYELISRSDTEIRFNVVGYYKERISSDGIYTLSKCAQPITMVLGENGWRFSLFADTGHIPAGLIQETVAEFYLDDQTITALMERYLTHEMYTVYSSLPVDYTQKDDSGDYYKVTDERFDTWAELTALVDDTFANDALKDASAALKVYKNVDGYTYCCPADMGWYLSREYTYSIIVQNPEDAVVRITRQEVDFGTDDFTHVDRSWNFRMCMTDDGWRIYEIAPVLYHTNDPLKYTPPGTGKPIGNVKIANSYLIAYESSEALPCVYYSFGLDAESFAMLKTEFAKPRFEYKSFVLGEITESGENGATAKVDFVKANGETETLTYTVDLTLPSGEPNDPPTYISSIWHY